MLKFEIIGKPMGKERPRVIKGIAYTPNKTKSYETFVRYTFINEFPNFTPMENAVKAKITAYFEVPKSYSKKKKKECLTNLDYIHKPDVDNISKIILDALNGLAYHDDNQVSCLLVFKNYTDGQEKVVVELEEIDKATEQEEKK